MHALVGRQVAISSRRPRAKTAACVGAEAPISRQFFRLDCVGPVTGPAAAGLTERVIVCTAIGHRLNPREILI